MLHRVGLWSIALTCAISSATSAQPDLLWSEQFGTPDAERTTTLAVDGSGGVFVAGYAFFARYSADGQQAWAQFGGLSIVNLLFDGDSGVFVTGSNGLGVVSLGRYNHNGGKLWEAEIDLPHEEGHPGSLAPDGEGGVFVTGSSRIPQHWETSVGFLARYDGAGEQIWFLSLGPPEGTSAGGDLAPDGAGGLLLNGYSSEDLGGLGPGSFLARYDADGERVWIRQPVPESLSLLAAIPSGGAFSAGRIPGQGNDYSDASVTRLDEAGNEVWSAQFGSPALDSATDLFTDDQGGVVIAVESDKDVLVARYDGAGSQTWLLEYGTPALEWGRAVAPDESGGFYLAGYIYMGGNGGDDTDAYLAHYGDACYSDLTNDGTLDLFDFLAFVNLFNAQDPAADCDHDGAFTLFDFLCFTNAFNAGC